MIEKRSRRDELQGEMRDIELKRMEDQASRVLDESSAVSPVQNRSGGDGDEDPTSLPSCALDPFATAPDFCKRA